MICDEIESSMAVTPPGPAGLCGSCRFAEIVVSSRGSIFYLCTLSATNPEFPRYPVLRPSVFGIPTRARSTVSLEAMSVASHLGIDLNDYDSRIRTFIPHYEEMLDVAGAA